MKSASTATSREAGGAAPPSAEPASGTAAHFEGLIWTLRLMPENGCDCSTCCTVRSLSRSSSYLSEDGSAARSFSSTSRETIWVSSSMARIFLIFSSARASLFLPSSASRRGSVVFIFSFCFGVRSPCLTTATSARSSGGRVAAAARAQPCSAGSVRLKRLAGRRSPEPPSDGGEPMWGGPMWAPRKGESSPEIARRAMRRRTAAASW
mmetsp:Transcript_15179/g.45005  ORF Transcript_15179/g.45005 Transcript_15179/m.45005 type:complete len:208 (-) Transcript_15179:269-892(-)